VDDSESEVVASLRKRLGRERNARREAEAIADRVTGELYASTRELQRVNAELQGANEELSTLNQSMRDFVAVASHDLRTPLTAILGATSTLKHAWDRVNAEQRVEFVAMIERQAQHLSRMVDDLLTLSRIEAGALHTQAEVVALRDAIERATSTFNDREPPVTIHALELQILTDPDHLERMLVNFIGNAYKYGEPPIEIEVSDAGAWAEIRVRDHGDGVPEDFVPRLFGKFARGDAARTLGGTGLGLSIVQGLARANGGDTWYEPNHPNGSCFALRLPKSAA
jgi:signal transduction histidine kinase